jgi:NADPH2:quinone reductase
MRAMAITEFTGPEGLRILELPAPEPGPGQVSLDVHYAGANFVDALFSRGLVPVPLPWIPGIEATGTVRALGEGVEGIDIGQQVAALTITAGGAYGQVAVAHASLITPVPTGLDLAVAAAVPSNTTTAILATERVARLVPGSHVLVHAAVGGLGSQIGQAARLAGAERVVAVVGSDAKVAAAKRLGYDDVWLRSELAERDPAQFDVVFDPVGGEARTHSLPLLRLGGTLVAVGNASQSETLPIDTNRLWLEGKGVVGFNLAALAAADPTLIGGYLARAVDAVARGAITLQLEKTEPLSEAGAVLARLETGSTSGKTVLALVNESPR